MRRNTSDDRPKHSNKEVEKELAFLESLGWTVIFSEQAQQFHLVCQVGKESDPCIRVGKDDGAGAVRTIKSAIAGPHYTRHPKSYPAPPAKE